MAGLPIPLGRAPPINWALRQRVVPQSPAFTGFIWSKSSLTDSSRNVHCWTYASQRRVRCRELRTLHSVDLAGIEPACKESPTCGFISLTNPFRPKVDPCGSPRSRPSQTGSTST